MYKNSKIQVTLALATALCSFALFGSSSDKPNPSSSTIQTETTPPAASSSWSGWLFGSTPNKNTSSSDPSAPPLLTNDNVNSSRFWDPVNKENTITARYLARMFGDAVVSLKEMKASFENMNKSTSADLSKKPEQEKTMFEKVAEKFVSMAGASSELLKEGSDVMKKIQAPGVDKDGKPTPSALDRVLASNPLETIEKTAQESLQKAQAGLDEWSDNTNAKLQATLDKTANKLESNMNKTADHVGNKLQQGAKEAIGELAASTRAELSLFPMYMAQGARPLALAAVGAAIASYGAYQCVKQLLEYQTLLAKDEQCTKDEQEFSVCNGDTCAIMHPSELQGLNEAQKEAMRKAQEQERAVERVKRQAECRKHNQERPTKIKQMKQIALAGAAAFVGGIIGIYNVTHTEPRQVNLAAKA